MRSLKTSRKKNSIVTMEQEIVLIFSRHFVVAKKKGYMLVVEYECPKGEVLYEVVYGSGVRYFCLLEQKQSTS